MSYNVICDRCGFKFKNDQLEKEWDGFMVCSQCIEPRHPQDMVRVPIDQKPLPWTRPRPADVEIPYPFDESLQTEIPTGTFTTNNGTLDD